MNLKNSTKAFYIVIMLFSLSSIHAQSTQTRQTVQDVGDVLHTAIPLAAGLSTIIIKDKEGSWQFAKSFGVNLALTYGLKHAINKSRPQGNSDGLAFPSGHTSVTFQGASFIQKRYGWSYGIPAYALAGLVAYSRIEGIDRRHDGWDVLGGIIVGIGSTYIFTTPYQREHYELAFSSSDNNYLVGLKFKF